MEISIPAAVIATFISTSISVLVTLLLSRKNDKKNFDEQLDNILKLAIQYPYLESENFTKSWIANNLSDDDKYLRYDIYCTLLLNYLSRYFKYYNYNKKKVENQLAVKDWVRHHKYYWLYPTNSYENIDSYDKKFRSIIEDYLK